MKNAAKSMLSIYFLVALAACDGPVWQFPGGALQGAEASLAGAVIPANGGVLELETAPADPYSVHVGYRNIAGEMYVDPAPERGWYQRIQQDPLVRVRLEGDASVYLAKAVPVTDNAILRRYEEGRVVLRLVSR